MPMSIVTDNEECDMALAGGVSINVSQMTGYRYSEGGMASPHGHCRAFDGKAQGTIFGRGGGIVVLKRLADVLSDRDTIHAVIKGAAINNDGSFDYPREKVWSKEPLKQIGESVAQAETDRRRKEM
jgi:acyl transferase domain-containing protein